jgi:hypothetical protein
VTLHLGIAEGTTKIHTAALLRALGARHRTEVAFIAARLVGSTVRIVVTKKITSEITRLSRSLAQRFLV